MKKKALATKMAAFVMAGAMTMAMGFPALADETTPVEAQAEATEKTVSLTKKVTTDGKTYAPNTTFRFKISTKTVAEGNGIDKTGKEDGLRFATTHNQEGSLAFAPEASKTDGKTTTIVDPKAEYTKDLALEINENAFKVNGKVVPGRYHYEIVELDDKYDGITYSTVHNNVIVYVYDDGNGGYKYVLSNVAIPEWDKEKETEEQYKKRLEDAKNNIEFINTYGTSLDESLLKDITITKKIAGDFASSNDDFGITITVNGDEGEHYYVEYKETATGDVKKEELASGTGKQLTIKATGNIVVHGISPKDTVSVEETAPGNGYTAKYEITTTNVDKTKCNENSGYNGTLPTNVKNTDLLITNTKNAATPTGIVTEYAPYILLVAAAGAFAVLFLRRKKEEF